MPVNACQTAVPHQHVKPEVLADVSLVEAVVRKVLLDVALVEPISVSEIEAARMVGVCGKTLGSFPAEQTGKLKLGRRTVYELARLRQFVRDRIGTEN